MHKLMIFIDGSNLYHETDRFQRGMRVDFEKLRGFLSKDFDLIRTFYYASRPAMATSEQEGFFKKMGYLGFKTRIKPLRESIGENGRRDVREKGVDVALATDLVANGMRRSYDWAIVVSGDQDYCEAIEQVQTQGLRVQVSFFRHAMADELKLIADRFTYLDDIVDRIVIQRPTTPEVKPQAYSPREEHTD